LSFKAKGEKSETARSLAPLEMAPMLKIETLSYVSVPKGG